MGFRTVKLEITEEDQKELEKRGVALQATGYTASNRYDFLYRLVFFEAK